jgi:hypothetical protein
MSANGPNGGLHETPAGAYVNLHRPARRRRDLAQNSSEPDATRAVARLPCLEIEIVHRRPTDNVEQISINLQATPSFEAFGRFVRAANPFVFWLQAAQIAWQPWLVAARMFAPATAAPPLPYLFAAPPVAKDDDA